MTRHTDSPEESAAHAAEHIQAEMNTAAFGAAHAAAVSEARQESQIALIWAELRWHKYLLMVLAGGIFGQYLGLADAVSQAMPFR